MMQRKMLYACCVMVFIGAVSGGAVQGTEPTTTSGDAVDGSGSSVLTADEVSSRAQRMPNLPTHHIYYKPSTGESGFVAGGEPPIGSDDPVYVNTPPPNFFVPPGAGRRIADDIFTVAVGGCSLTGYEVSFARGPSRCSFDSSSCEVDTDCAQVPFEQTCDPWPDPGFEVEFALYDGCPNSGGTLIPGTEGVMTFTENALYVITVDLSDNPIPNNGALWVAAEFDRNGAGWVVGTPASTGFTENVYDFPFPSFFCSARFTGTPLYAGFHTKIFCTDVENREFLAYFNPELTGGIIAHPSGASNRFLADDLQLIVDECVMTSYAVGISGSPAFTATVELWRGCSPSQLIEGTSFEFDAIGDGSPEFARASFPEGIDLGTGNVWVAVKQSVSTSGPIQANEATLGATDQTFGIFDWPGQPPGCGWILTGTHTGFAATVSCLGNAPTGACCDLATVEEIGDEPNCREVTQIACQGNLTRYNQGTSCPMTCLVDNLPCASDLDCEAMVCSGSLEPCTMNEDCLEGQTCQVQTCVQLGESFDPACGTSACCTPPNSQFGENCVDLPIDECVTIEDTDQNPAIWNRGVFCNNPEFACFRWVCRYADGNCDLAHGLGVGCNIPSCCDKICNQDEWCCEVEWDQTCADRAVDENFGCALDPTVDECTEAVFVDVSQGVCSGGGACDPQNGDDDCPGLETCNLPSIKLNTVGAGATPNETFCCTTVAGGSSGGGGVWAKFIAETSSMLITTEDAGPGDAIDPIIEVYLAEDTSSPEAACSSLVQQGCDDDSGFQQQAELTLYSLSPGAEYYLLLAGKGASAQGTYRVEFEWPAPGTNDAPGNDRCEAAITVSSATSLPYDLTNAIVDCPWESCLPGDTAPGDPPNPTKLDNDIWYSYFPIFTGLLTVDTCGTEDTAIVVYNTGTCPPTIFERIECNDDGPEGCAPGSEVTFPVAGGQLYLIRLSGIDGGEPSGMINFSDIVADCNLNEVPDDEDIAMGTSDDCNGNGIPDECDGGCLGITGSVPPDGSIDARQPTNTDGTGGYGIMSVVLSFSSDTSGATVGDFTISSSAGTAPGIAGLISAGNDLTINLDGPIPVGTWTTITHTPSGDSVCYGYLPGDVGSNDLVNDVDILDIIDALNGTTTPPLWSTDLDQSGANGPEDLLRLLDLANGGDSFDPWFGVSVTGTCP